MKPLAFLLVTVAALLACGDSTSVEIDGPGHPPDAGLDAGDAG